MSFYSKKRLLIVVESPEVEVSKLEVHCLSLDLDIQRRNQWNFECSLRGGSNVVIANSHSHS